MYKTTTIVLMSALLFAACASTEDQNTTVSVDIYLMDRVVGTVVYNGPASSATALRDELAVALQGAHSVTDSPASFVVHASGVAVGGFIALPADGVVDIEDITDPMAAAYGFVASSSAGNHDSTATTQSALKRLCNADVCKELQCIYGIISPANCDLPLCANQSRDFAAATPRSCGLPGFSPCRVQLCSPFGCFCAYN